MSLVLPLILLVFVGLMVMNTRRQRREAAKTQEMQTGVAAGDRVMTTSGLYATVVGLGEDTVDLEIDDGVVTTWSRLVIKQVITEDETAEDDGVLVDGAPLAADEHDPTEAAPISDDAARTSLRKP